MTVAYPVLWVIELQNEVKTKKAGTVANVLIVEIGASGAIGGHVKSAASARIGWLRQSMEAGPRPEMKVGALRLFAARSVQQSCGYSHHSRSRSLKVPSELQGAC